MASLRDQRYQIHIGCVMFFQPFFFFLSLFVNKDVRQLNSVKNGAENFSRIFPSNLCLGNSIIFLAWHFKLQPSGSKWQVRIKTCPFVTDSTQSLFGSGVKQQQSYPSQLSLLQLLWRLQMWWTSWENSGAYSTTLEAFQGYTRDLTFV